MAIDVFAPTRRWAADSATVKRWRSRRYERFCELVRSPLDSILDVGAGRGSALERFNATNPITALDLEPQDGPWLRGDNVTFVQGDATALAYPDRSFDIAFSNSVIEHISREQQAAFAAEIRRVATSYFVQTPNYWFPIEPHWQLPLVHYLPVRARKALNRRFSFGWMPRHGYREINLLSVRELRRLFPDAEIQRERVGGLTKSIIAVRRPPAGPAA
jgi:SAM-dependent methyltransferase